MPSPPGIDTGARVAWRPVLMVSAVVLVLGFFAIPTTRHLVIGQSSSRWVQLTSGSYRGVAWRLDAQEKNGTLCMVVDGPGGPTDSAHGFSGQCGFDDARPLDSFYAVGLGPAGSSVRYGPLPSAATAVRLADGRVVATAALPRVPGLPHGRYWIAIFPGVGAPGPPSIVRPLDSHGQPVPFKRF